MNDNRLVHIVAWPEYLRYVRGEKVTSPDWRPLKVDFSVAATLDRTESLTLAECGALLRLVLAYASAPLIDPADPKGPRRLPYARAMKGLSARGVSARRMLERLEQERCIALGPSQDRPVQFSAVPSSGVEFSAVESSDDASTKELLDDIYGATSR